MDRTMFDEFGEGGFGTMRVRLRREGWLSGNDIALMLERNPDQPLPNDLRDYVVAALRNGLKRKRGVAKDPNVALRDAFMVHFFEHAEQVWTKWLARRDRREKAGGVVGRRADGSPRDWAAETTAKRLRGLFKPVAPGTIRNRMDKLQKR